ILRMSALLIAQGSLCSLIPFLRATSNAVAPFRLRKKPAHPANDIAERLALYSSGTIRRLSATDRPRTRLLNCPVAGASPNITQSNIHHMISMRAIVTRGFKGVEEPGIAIANVHESLIGHKKL